MLWVYLIWLLLYWGMFLLCLLSGRFFFYHKWMLNFVKGFLCICWDNHMVFIFQFVNVMYHIDLQMLKNPCIPGIKPTWSRCMVFLIWCWILFAKILLRVFKKIINGCWILSKAFSASIEVIIWFLSFNLLMWCITLIDLRILKNPCIPGKKPTWSWCMIFLICCWILFARILLRIFVSMFISDILACSFLFLWHLCLVLELGWWRPHRMSFEVYLLLQFSGRVWVR